MGEYGVRAWNGRQNSTAPQVSLISTLKCNNNQIITIQCRDSIPALHDQESALPAEMPVLNLQVIVITLKNIQAVLIEHEIYFSSRVYFISDRVSDQIWNHWKCMRSDQINVCLRRQRHEQKIFPSKFL